MAKFENRYGVRKIVYKQKCRCFCPIGKADYTNEFTVTMEPAEIIPDYCEIDKFIRECLEGESLVIEEAASKLKKKLLLRERLLRRRGKNWKNRRRRGWKSLREKQKLKKRRKK